MRDLKDGVVSLTEAMQGDVINWLVSASFGLQQARSIEAVDRHELWWCFTQGSFVSSSEDFIVGDYTGDGRDDVLIYPRGGGAWRMYSLTDDFFFSATPSFAPGNLGTARPGLRVRTGDFNAGGRDDVALVNGWGQVLYFASDLPGLLR